MSSSIGSRIRGIRGKKSRADFAEQLGIGTATLQRYEKDERSPDIDFLIKIKDLSGYSIDYLIYGKDASLPTDENLLLEKFRQGDAVLKNKMLMLLLGIDADKTTNGVVNQSQSINNGVQIGHNSGLVKSHK